MTNAVCNEYNPDIVAQGDCINCGNGFEFHQRKTNFVEQATKTWPKIVGTAVDQCVKNLNKPRKPQVKLTVTVNDRSGGIIPQVILIPGETQMHQLDEAVRKAVIEQTVHDGTCIMRVSYQP